jgi:hypothetical protein
MTAPVKVTIKDWGKGLNKDQPSWELAPGFWSDGQNVRFRVGKAERVGGIASVITPSITPYFVLGYSSGATRYAAYCGLTKAYVHDGTTETEITRTNAPSIQTITNATHAASTVTITTGSAHGLTTGDILTLTGFTPSAYNKTNATITVTTTTAFTYTNGGIGSAASPATTMGTYSIVSHAAASIVNFTAGLDDKWTGGNFNGVMYVNNPVDGLYYWDQSVTGKLHNFPDASSFIQDAARHFKNYIFLLAPTTSGTKYRHRVQWSAAADPGSIPTSFTTLSTNDSGLVDLPSEGECVDAFAWGESFIIYKRDMRFRCTYIGGNFVFQFDPILGHKDDGLLAANCAVNTPKGQVFITDGHDIRIHQGGPSQSIAIGRVLNYFRGAIDSTNRKRAFVATNPYTNEVWVCFPESGQSACTKALLWNWEDDTWGIRDLTGVTYGASGELPTSIATTARMLVSNTTPKIGLVDSGTTDFGSTYTTTLERTGMDFDSPNYKTLNASLPVFDGSTAFTASVFHGSSATQDGTPTYASAATYTHNTTTKVTAFANSGKFLAYKLTSTASDPWTLRSIQFWLKEDGEY